MSTEEPISDTENPDVDIDTDNDSDSDIADIKDDKSSDIDADSDDEINIVNDDDNEIDGDGDDDDEIDGDTDNIGGNDSDDDDTTTKPLDPIATSDDSDDSDEDFDDEYLQKFSNNLKKSLVDEYHTDAQLHNNAEIKQLSLCVKNSQGIVVDDLHKTVPIMSKFEYTRILGIRAKQLNNGAKPFVKVPDGIIDGYLIAKIELESKVLPFIIRRPIPNGASEYWKVKDLEILM